MPVSLDDEFKRALLQAKLSPPHRDAFEIRVTADDFPPIPLRDEPGLPDKVDISPDSGIKLLFAGHLNRLGILAFAAEEEDFSDSSSRTVLIACASEVEKIASIPEVKEIKLLRQGCDLLVEFNTSRLNSLHALLIEQECKVSAVEVLRRRLEQAFTILRTSFRPE